MSGNIQPHVIRLRTGIVCLTCLCVSTAQILCSLRGPVCAADSKDPLTIAQDDLQANEARELLEVRRYKYVGNSFSLKFHKPSCPFARAMRTSRAVVFEFRKAAIDAGHQPCKYCLPPWWLKVEAKILSGNSSQEATQQADTPLNHAQTQKILPLPPNQRTQSVEQASTEAPISTAGNGLQSEPAKDEAFK